MAQRRIANNWGLQSVEGYDLLIAPADCALLGRSGWLVVNGDWYEAIVVDCSQAEHRQAMIDNGLLADVNRDLKGEGWLVLR